MQNRRGCLQTSPKNIVPFGVTYEKIGTIQRRLAWPLHKDDTLSRSGRPTGLNIYFCFIEVSQKYRLVMIFEEKVYFHCTSLADKIEMQLFPPPKKISSIHSRHSQQAMDMNVLTSV